MKPFFRRGFLSPPSPVVGIFVFINIGVFLLSLIARFADSEAFLKVFEHLALVPANLLHFEIQGLLTSIFLHDPSNVFHILFNMLLLWQLGPHVEFAVGAKKFAFLYIGAGFCGSIVYSAWALLFSDPFVPVIGASGAVLGVVAGFSFLFPQARLMLWFFQPIKAIHLLYLVVILDLIFFISDRNIAIQAHFGGMLFGYLYIVRPWTTRVKGHFRWRPR